MSNLTKKALAASIVQLLDTEPLDKITVKDITDNCGVTRNTFYYHFNDIYDLCKWIFAIQTEEILSRYRDEDTWEDGFLCGLRYLYDHRTMVYHVYRSISKSDLERYLYRVSEKYALKLVNVMTEGMGIDRRTRIIVAGFYKNAFIGSVLQWIEDDMATEPEKLAALCNGIFRGTVDNAIESVDKVLEN